MSRDARPVRDRVVVADAALQERYISIPATVANDNSLSPAARLLYGVMLDYAWQKDQCFPAQQTLADRFNTTVRTIQNWLRELYERGYLEWEQRGRGHPNLYTMHVLPLRHLDGAKNLAPLDGNGAKEFSPGDTKILSPRGTKNLSHKPTYKEPTLTEPTRTPTESGLLSPDGSTDGESPRPVPLYALSEGARTVVDDWRKKQCRLKAPQINQLLARQLEAAVADVGVERLLDSNTWAAENQVPGLLKAIRAAYTKRKMDEHATSERLPATVRRGFHRSDGAAAIPPDELAALRAFGRAPSQVG